MTRFWKSTSLPLRLAILAIAAAIVLPIAWYLGSPLFINQVVNKPFPAIVAPAQNQPAFVTRKDWANKLLSVQSPFFASVQSVRPTDDPLTSDLVARFYPRTIVPDDYVGRHVCQCISISCISSPKRCTFCEVPVILTKPLEQCWTAAFLRSFICAILQPQ